MAKLTGKQQRFVDEYLIDLNATQAAIRAGYSEKNAMRIGYQLTHRPEIEAALSEAMQARGHRTQITQDWVLEELYRVAASNGTHFSKVVVENDTAYVKPVGTEELSQSQRSAIASIEATKYGIKVGSYDKVRALELLGKHLGLFDGKSAQERESESNLFTAIKDGAQEELETDDIPEIKQAAAAGHDVVEPPELSPS